ncbi:protein CHROMATIN REMODELING 19-like isoform X2 [Pyrus x bretschneideri]|uniref:protein CHROMATIN REMODELING 19-like isoform X2 n=1 Tax=Pyrus x bretschneideri TaxID=225117 RepID=UPI00202E7BC5|nr:protein CHROMATIN REMODELING 19-like isoform X2 [Pyrus x bretschneideri]XP_048432350.1 protein CHROMATIN REMODELING 19-like isoform X2 [Pyrus x bretschneideri]
MSTSEDEEVEELEDDDIIGKALQKCAKISVDLRKKLQGSSALAVSDWYTEVEAASVKIVNQPFWSTRWVLGRPFSAQQKMIVKF